MENIILPDGSHVYRYIDIAGQHWLLHFDREGSIIDKCPITENTIFERVDNGA